MTAMPSGGGPSRRGRESAIVAVGVAGGVTPLGRSLCVAAAFRLAQDVVDALGRTHHDVGLEHELGRAPQAGLRGDGALELDAMGLEGLEHRLGEIVTVEAR